jgi:predicted dehydrogenase
MITIANPLEEAVMPPREKAALIKFGVVGYGYWGPNVVRNLDRLDETKVVAVCDKSPAAQRKVAKAYPDVRVTDDPVELMSSPDIDAIAVVTPVWTHYELAKAALQNGKHVFVEKPPSCSQVRSKRSSNYCRTTRWENCITTIPPA